MTAHGILKCNPALRAFYEAQPREVQNALGAWILRYALTEREPTPAQVAPEVWETARGMIRPVRRKGSRA